METLDCTTCAVSENSPLAWCKREIQDLNSENMGFLSHFQMFNEIYQLDVSSYYISCKWRVGA